MQPKTVIKLYKAINIVLAIGAFLIFVKCWQDYQNSKAPVIIEEIVFFYGV